MPTSNKLTDERLKEIAALPVTYDDDIPEFSDSDLKGFAPAAISNSNNETNLVEYYASEPFNSVVFYIDRKETLKGDKVWRCEMSLGTRKCGVDYVVADVSKEKVVSKDIEVLKESGAIVDADEEKRKN